MILKKGNVERIVKSEATIRHLKNNGWIEVVEEKKKSIKKENKEGAE